MAVVVTFLFLLKFRSSHVKLARGLRHFKTNLGPGEASEPKPPPITHAGQVETLTPAGPPRSDPVTTEIILPERLSLETTEGKDLVLDPGSVTVSFRLSFHPERSSEQSFAQDYPVVETWVTDADGARWYTRTFLDPIALTEPLTPDGLPASKGELRFWTNAPEAWRKALEEYCLLAEARDMLDTRERFHLPVGDEEYTVMLKYQGPLLDVAWLEEEKRLLVRAAEMYYEIWEEGEWADVVDRVCFGYRLDPVAILPISATDRNWVEWEGWEESEKPRSLRFERL